MCASADFAESLFGLEVLREGEALNSQLGGPELRENAAQRWRDSGTRARSPRVRQTRSTTSSSSGRTGEVEGVFVGRR